MPCKEYVILSTYMQDILIKIGLCRGISKKLMNNSGQGTGEGERESVLQLKCWLGRELPPNSTRVAYEGC